MKRVRKTQRELGILQRYRQLIGHHDICANSSEFHKIRLQCVARQRYRHFAVGCILVRAQTRISASTKNKRDTDLWQTI